MAPIGLMPQRIGPPKERGHKLCDASCTTLEKKIDCVLKETDDDSADRRGGNCLWWWTQTRIESNTILMN
jgi:hypothetical protein